MILNSLEPKPKLEGHAKVQTKIFFVKIICFHNFKIKKIDSPSASLPSGLKYASALYCEQMFVIAGGFRVEMKRCHRKDRTVLCCYNPTECGLYTIYIRWSGVDIPESPFHVRICQTSNELECYERSDQDFQYSFYTPCL